MKLISPITFFYYDDIDKAADFYQNVMKLTLVEDQGWAKIFRINAASYVGAVDGSRGFHHTQPESAVLLTLVVDNVSEWYAYLKDKVKITREPSMNEEIQVENFFFEDPGGYSLEIQTFHRPEVARIFQS